jgi:ADP-ribose pyrophosphatase YjhB (NUDIX family)
VEYGETVLAAIKREIKEETNLEITPIDVVSALDMIGPLTADAIPEYQFLILGMT